MSDVYYEDDDAPALDPEVLEEMQEWAAEQQAAYEAAAEEKYSEIEARWAEEDAAAEQEAYEEQLDAETEQAVVQRVAAACAQAGITDHLAAVDVWKLAEGLFSDPAFTRQHRDPSAGVDAAIAEAVKLVQPGRGDDVMVTAERYMARKRALERYEKGRAGGGATDELEARIAAHAELLGSTREEIQQARELFGLAS